MNNDFHAQDSDFGREMISAFSIDRGTNIHLLPENPLVETSGGSSLAHPKLGHGYNNSNTEVNFSKLGGLSKEFAVLKDIIVSSAVQVTVASLGLRPTKGVLLHGPPGTGKTTLARVCTHDAGVNMFSVNGPEIISQYHGETEQALHEVFNKASQASPAVVFIDELDAIAPARKDGGDELSQRMVATLLNLMDGTSKTDGILVIAATNRPDSIEPALRRPGRLDREIEIGVPSPRQRHEILLALLSGMEHSLLEKDIHNLAMATHGFVGADLAALCNEAALARLRQYVKLTKSCDVGATQTLPDSVKENLEAAFSCTLETQHSSEFMDGIGVNRTSVLKDVLRVTPEDFEKARIRVRPSAMREVILEVPKVGWEDVGVRWRMQQNSFGSCCSSEAGLNFLAVKGPELFSKWVGESEKAVRLQQRGSVTVIAATNRPDKIDPALLRPGCTGADISLICREAAIKAIEENLSASEITMEHLKVGIQQVQPSDVQMYEKLSGKFQRLVHSTANEDDLECEPCSDKSSHIALWYVSLLHFVPF
ncbi:UNVERIFIED_CONTAM: Calmodulin-interacting protein [Sesamum radiatum]|uniref:Calmodulin-interacting protein n=1 Tax=Sesamum radiatum TaxID=300843 RepID=A0AAW2TKT3_SESRA